MGYLKTIENYPPYALMNDKRGFISRRYGNGHSGVDSVGNEWNNPVCAVIDGKVIQVFKDPQIGNVVKYGYDGFVVGHYHLASVSVKTGQSVKAGKTKIGVEGNTGSLSNGKHLHTGIWVNGSLVDPEPYLTGKKKFPTQNEVKNEWSDEYMIRKVTQVLNLRSSRSLANDNNIVYRDMPVGTVFLVTETVTESGTKWGHVYVTINGKSYSGWSNLATTWSKEV